MKPANGDIYNMKKRVITLSSVSSCEADRRKRRIHQVEEDNSIIKTMINRVRLISLKLYMQ